MLKCLSLEHSLYCALYNCNHFWFAYNYVRMYLFYLVVLCRCMFESTLSPVVLGCHASEKQVHITI